MLDQFLHNSGLLLRLIVEPWWRWSAHEALQVLNVVSAALQFMAMVVFAWAMQKRVRTKEFIIAVREAQRRGGT